MPISRPQGPWELASSGEAKIPRDTREPAAWDVLGPAPAAGGKAYDGTMAAAAGISMARRDEMDHTTGRRPAFNHRYRIAVDTGVSTHPGFAIAARESTARPMRHSGRATERAMTSHRTSWSGPTYWRALKCSAMLRLFEH